VLVCDGHDGVPQEVSTQDIQLCRINKTGRVGDDIQLEIGRHFITVVVSQGIGRIIAKIIDVIETGGRRRAGHEILIAAGIMVSASLAGVARRKQCQQHE
jgi:hypothetical protein